MNLYPLFFQTAIPNRISGIHFVNTPVVFHTVLAMGLPFLKEKMRRRVSGGP